MATCRRAQPTLRPPRWQSERALELVLALALVLVLVLVLVLGSGRVSRLRAKAPHSTLRANHRKRGWVSNCGWQSGAHCIC